MSVTPSSDGFFEAYWPRGARRSEMKRLAPRLPALDGKRVAFLWDYLFRGDEMFETLQQALAQRFAGMSFVDWREFGNLHSNDERAIVAGLPAKLKAHGVDAVVVAVAA